MSIYLTAAVLGAALLTIAPPTRSQQAAPDWNLTGPAADRQAQPMQRRQLSPVQQPMSVNGAAGADAAVGQEPAARIPDGYRAQRLPPSAASDDRQRGQSQLPESSMPEDRQIAILRKRVAELIRQMDDLQVRMAVSEQALASHRHSYTSPNMGFISVETYNNYFERMARDRQPVPFFSGRWERNTTEPPMVPR